ncbi:Tripartite tricarboxylate transporter family receptor [Hartmannibacter diazotrophicus]|uniref:Tripartite tricarboxylate transporter family receptor n=1 Tax=Hartmannibacter diazotrophicus TaxID=1482074 RepID=A0A2C9D9V2_9HYPH|nr:tripartite tricarboxylate transporter substrate-binding protein [Hartmannibacter diazotrophicus]SON56918.1 Tripartite tricarboxylate transporter family receptor [Hartmannibacter diazotrophicus]
MKKTVSSFLAGVAAVGAFALGTVATPALAWEPDKTVEFIVPAGSGGGADQMARMIQGVIQKHNLMSQPLVVINRGGGSGAEGFLDVKSSEGNPDKIIITLSNVFTTPMATGVPFSWKDLTPVAMMALDEFILWVNAQSPYKTPAEYIDAVKEGGPSKFQMGGTGSKQEDQIITAAIEQNTGAKFTYVPYKGGGTVAAQLVGNHITSSVNNPIEAVSQWRAGELRPLCVFDSQRVQLTDKVTADMSWGDIPTCTEAGLPIEYLMLRGIMMPPGVSQEQVDYYVDVLSKVRETPEWKDFMAKGAFNTSFMKGEEYHAWLEKAEATHHDLMDKAGFLKK